MGGVGGGDSVDLVQDISDASMIGFYGGELFAELCMSGHRDKAHRVGDFFDRLHRFDTLPHMYEFCHDRFTYRSNTISLLPYGIPVYLAMDNVGGIMQLIIDGYNLIRSVTHKRATEPDIQQMLGRLRRYQRVTEHDIVIVFDGGDGLHRYQTGYHGLTVWYSGVRETADHLIKDFLRGAHPDGTVLISNDRQLNEAAQEYDIVSVSPLLFLARIKEREGFKLSDTKSVLKAIKTSSEANVELDALMEAYSGSAGSKKEREPEVDAMPKNKKSSKLERRLEALIRKL